MDNVWRSAPHPALRWWRDGAPCEPNAAALAWAQALGLTAVPWPALADAVCSAPEALCWPLGAQATVHGRAVALDDGGLLWWASEDADSAGLRRALMQLGVTLWRIDWTSGRIAFHPLGAPPMGLAAQAARDGMTIDEVRALMHPDDRESNERAATAARHGPGVIDALLRYRMQDGHWAPLLSRRVAERDADGRPVALLGLSMDVEKFFTERDALLRQRERLAEAADAAGLGLWYRTGPPASAEWNDAMLRLYSRSREQGVPQLDEWYREIVHPLDVERFRADQERCEAGWLPVFHTEFRLRTSDGRPKWIYAWSRRGERDGERYAFGLHIDITERHEAQAVQQERERLEQLRLAQSAFLARVSHELRTPMNAVLGFTQLLGFDRHEPLSPRQSERVQRIEVAGRHLLALIDDVLDLARIEADQQPYQRTAVVLDDVAREALGWVSAQARQAGITLRIAEAALAGVVLADRRRLGQVVVNLLTNAIKYNRAGGQVEVTARSDASARHALVVRDSGRGMTTEQCRRAFEPFDRLGTENEGIDGTGIGLTIVRQLMQRMGGEVQVQSQPAVGSEFSVWLPAADGAQTQAAALPAPPAEPAAQLRTLRVLCIDDHATNLQLVHDLLALRPGTVFEGAANGRAGLAAALARPPDVVLLDLQLPDLHGTEVLARLREVPSLKACRMIALSANAIPADVSAALGKGFDDYWTKPIDARRFLAGIDALRQP